jgi:hypothetical protein
MKETPQRNLISVLVGEGQVQIHLLAEFLLDTDPFELRRQA